jgi:lipooligosaccharide transport system ATP-binding protein
MDEAERLCDRLMIMDRGKILAEGAPRDLIARHVGHEVVELHADEEEQARVLSDIDLGGTKSERSGDVRAFFFERGDSMVESVVERARASGIRCLVRNATLEDVFLKLTGRELDE